MASISPLMISSVALLSEIVKRSSDCRAPKVCVASCRPGGSLSPGSPQITADILHERLIRCSR
jgi:hypothetical protein